MAMSINKIAKNLPLLRGLAHRVPPYFVGSVLENRLGLQVFRLIGKHVAWRLRSRSTDSYIRQYLNTLERDGVLVIPDFLPEEDFQRVKREHDSAKSEMTFGSFREIEYGRLQVANFDLNGDKSHMPAIRKCLQENPLILKLASAVIRREIKSNPSIRISVYRKVSDTAPDNDIENVLHADLHAPTVKAFYYLDDVDENNGAFVYVKGSHRLTLNRIRHEYSISVRTAKLNRGDEVAPNLLAERGTNARAVISEKQVGELEETPICGKANTLVIANNMGFHRRGNFTGEKPRETIVINFRLFEKCFWLLFLFFSHFSNLFNPLLETIRA